MTHCGTNATRMNKTVLESWRSKVVFWVCFVLFLIDVFWGGCYRGEGRIWRDWEVNGIGVHHVKSPKS